MGILDMIFVYVKVCLDYLMCTVSDSDLTLTAPALLEERQANSSIRASGQQRMQTQTAGFEVWPDWCDLSVLSGLCKNWRDPDLHPLHHVTNTPKMLWNLSLITSAAPASL